MEISEQKPVGLTGRYINALFELCSEKRIIQNVVSDLDNLKRLMFEDQYFKTSRLLFYSILKRLRSVP